MILPHQRRIGNRYRQLSVVASLHINVALSDAETCYAMLLIFGIILLLSIGLSAVLPGLGLRILLLWVALLRVTLLRIILLRITLLLGIRLLRVALLQVSLRILSESGNGDSHEHSEQLTKHKHTLSVYTAMTNVRH